ncbi:unnamed protein product, partial [Prorocentrum cordatum]
KHALTDIDGNPREAEPGEAPLEISADCKAFMKINDVCSAEIEEHCSSDFYGGDIMIRSAGASPSGPSRRRSELAARRRCRSRRPRRRGGRRGEGRLEGEAEGGQAAGDEGHQEGGQGPEAPPPPQEERPVRWRAARPPRARAGSSGLLYFPLSPILDFSSPGFALVLASSYADAPPAKQQHRSAVSAPRGPSSQLQTLGKAAQPLPGVESGALPAAGVLGSISWELGMSSRFRLYSGGAH